MGMGRDLLRRKILKVPVFTILLIALSSVILPGYELEVSAEEYNTYIPDLETLLLEENSLRLPPYSRPLRNRQDEVADTLANPGVLLPPNRTNEFPDRRDSLLLTPESLADPLTVYYIKQYTSPGGISWLRSVMERGGPYLAFIRIEINARNLPPELMYLPLIESGYLATAVSRSGAVGLWQFMKNSIAPFDIRVNDWVDERRDFWKSTQGALRKLEENYNYFKDWPLALAAYNAGLGGISRTIQQSGVRNYWVLSQRKLLKTETIHYVPKLLAAAHVLSNQRQYGMKPLWPEDPEWTQVKVERSVDIRLLASEAGLDSGQLMFANRELLYNITPPGQNYFLKVPQKHAGAISEVLSRKDIVLVNHYIHTIRPGDTLSALSLHYGTTVDQILALNPGVEARFLRIGSRLVIPALKETSPYTRLSNPSRENLVFNGIHLVKRGETLWSIALAYEVDPEVLAEANGMELNDILREGKTLQTPIK